MIALSFLILLISILLSKKVINNSVIKASSAFGNQKNKQNVPSLHTYFLS
jgi:hypothetical protein